MTACDAIWLSKRVLMDTFLYHYGRTCGGRVSLSELRAGAFRLGGPSLHCTEIFPGHESGGMLDFRCWRALPDVGKRWPSQLVATATEGRLKILAVILRFALWLATYVIVALFWAMLVGFSVKQFRASLCA
jgi:hypothetical protein